MFDFTSSKLLILGIIALIVVGPKDLPALLRTIGKYVGIIRRQAAEFRAQFDEAIRESEFEQIKKDVEKIGEEATQSMREAEASATKELAAADRELQAAVEAGPGSAGGLPLEPAEVAEAGPPATEPSPPHSEADAPAKPTAASGA